MKIYRYPSKAAERRLDAIVRRGVAFKAKDIREVTKIIDDVRRNGDRALLQYTRRFDAPAMKANLLQVSSAEFANAAQRVDRVFKRALNRAVNQIQSFHGIQRPKSWILADRPGTWLGQMVNPVDAAGIYVPGGKGGSTPLVSSVLMGAIPAKIAGVKRVIMVTPPS
ncbi:MAG: histidinol dehydrogenase, partial [Desulfobacteraceae bacterium]|nr:histidinol dehydrogenase [Desulfobacteraceae bacterium]